MESLHAGAGFNRGRREWLQRCSIAAGSAAFFATRAFAASGEEISRTAEAIHQEVIFQASAKRIYEALLDATEFQKLERQSAAAKSTDVNTHPAAIERDAGGAFSLFGGYIIGRQLELIANQRIVQAWRVQSWPSGIYSIVKFELGAQGTGTRLVFDHTGFPAGLAEHLAEGWQVNYWEPLRKILV
ncbi:MAG TPA: SRPBCC family protein [Candidatus Acidoferrum sp.]|nr:SRPBCC family protein [Candidatus Acidoferrum sp.]